MTEARRPPSVRFKPPMTDAEKAYWYRWAYLTVSEKPGLSVLVADKLRSLGLGSS